MHLWEFLPTYVATLMHPWEFLPTPVTTLGSVGDHSAVRGGGAPATLSITLLDSSRLLSKNALSLSLALVGCAVLVRERHSEEDALRNLSAAATSALRLSRAYMDRPISACEIERERGNIDESAYFGISRPRVAFTTRRAPSSYSFPSLFLSLFCARSLFLTIRPTKQAWAGASNTTSWGRGCLSTSTATRAARG